MIGKIVSSTVAFFAVTLSVIFTVCSSAPINEICEGSELNEEFLNCISSELTNNDVITVKFNEKISNIQVQRSIDIGILSLENVATECMKEVEMFNAKINWNGDIKMSLNANKTIKLMFTDLILEANYKNTSIGDNIRKFIINFTNIQIQSEKPVDSNIHFNFWKHNENSEALTALDSFKQCAMQVENFYDQLIIDVIKKHFDAYMQNVLDNLL